MKHEAINYCQTRLEADAEQIFKTGTKEQKIVTLMMMAAWAAYKWIKGIK